MSIHFTPNMSYCAVENTSMGLEQVLDLMQEHDTVADWIEDLNTYEQSSLPVLVECCREILEYLDEEVEHC